MTTELHEIFAVRNAETALKPASVLESPLIIDLLPSPFQALFDQNIHRQADNVRAVLDVRSLAEFVQRVVKPEGFVERTDGIPPFVEEMTKAVLEAELPGLTLSFAATSSGCWLPAGGKSRWS